MPEYSSGVQYVFGPPSTEAAARQAVVEQQGGDEFKPQESPDIEQLEEELALVENETTQLSMKLYGPVNWHMTHSEPYKGPPYMEKERIRRQMDKLDRRAAAIRAVLCLYVTDGDKPGQPYADPTAPLRQAMYPY